jgi:hypothetical protein
MPLWVTLLPNLSTSSTPLLWLMSRTGSMFGSRSSFQASNWQRKRRFEEFAPWLLILTQLRALHFGPSQTCHTIQHGPEYEPPLPCPSHPSGSVTSGPSLLCDTLRQTSQPMCQSTIGGSVTLFSFFLSFSAANLCSTYCPLAAANAACNQFSSWLLIMWPARSLGLALCSPSLG